ncbi:MAG: rhodanese-like domain-containing protein [Bacteroidetes bacterium]|nr:rhodanese-like domain-containing protein [Bacteroidota bacterium]
MYSLNPQQTTFVDVREKDELPRVDTFMCVDLPLSALAHQAHCISQFEKLLVFCQGGVRSEKAVRQLQILFPERPFYSIQGGILDSLSRLSNKLYATEV